MAIHKNAGTKLYISPTAIDPDAINILSDSAAIDLFEAINDWIEVEEVEDFGEIGDSAEAITFTAVGNRRVRKLKGPRDAGTQTIIVGRDPLDDGQEALIDAEAVDFNYPFMIEMADARTPGHSDSVLYYAGLVMTKPTNLGNVSNVVRRNFQVGINTAVYEVASAVLSTPTNTLEPSIAGVLDEGEVLTAIEGTWTGNPAFTYAWRRDGTPIAGATNRTYTIVGADVGTALSVTVTGTNTAGNASATSAATADVPA